MHFTVFCFLNFCSVPRNSYCLYRSIGRFESLRVSSILVDCLAMIAARSTKSGLPCYPAKIDVRQNCWDTSTVIQLKCRGYAMLNFSGHRVRANYSEGKGEGGRTRLIPGHPLKRVRANLYSAERFFFSPGVPGVSVRTADFFSLRRQRGQ